jgi:hypothetical protein
VNPIPSRGPALVRRAALAIVASAIVGACASIDAEPHAPRVSNATDQALGLFVITNGIPSQISTIEAGVTVDLGLYEGTCTGDVLVARTNGGAEIGRRSEPLCPDEVWLIEP